MTERECFHERNHATRFTLSNGAEAIYYQCDDCGEKVGNAVSKARFVEWRALPPFDVEKCNQRDKARADAVAQRMAEFKDKQGEFWNRYAQYLNSPEWQQVRRRAILRDNFTCQNCFAKVTDYNAHAHHLTYDSYKLQGVTYAFEVVTLCPKCHANYHEGRIHL